MLALFILIFFGLGAAYFATQNTGNVVVSMAGYSLHGMPLYTVVIVSILFGVLVSWLVNLVDSVSSGLTIHSKDSELRKLQKTISSLQDRNHELEIENVRLNGENNLSQNVDNDEKEHNNDLKPSFFSRLQHSW